MSTDKHYTPEETRERLSQWAERHADDREDYILGAFLTVGELRKLVDEPSPTQYFTELLQAEMEYWKDSSDPRIQEFTLGAVGALANVLGAVALGLTPEEFRKSIEKRDQPQ